MTSEHLLAAQPADVLAFWREAGPSRWFRKDEAFDAQFRARFLGAHEAAVRGEFDHWASDADGALALLILLDQFPRNAFRGSARMYASDEKARAVALRAIETGLDQRVDNELRNFFYLPLMHSENLVDQDRSVALARALAGDSLRYAEQHRSIIEKYGRFPHRNALLGRTSTPEELKFLADGGFAG